jgi:hypothetical protein
MANGVKPLTALLACAALLAASGCANATTESPHHSRGSAGSAPVRSESTPPPSAGDTVGPTPSGLAAFGDISHRSLAAPISTADALARLMPLIPPGVLSNVRFAAPPSDADGTVPGAWLNATVHVASTTDGTAMNGLWIAGLLQGDLAELINPGHDNLYDSLSGSTLAEQLPDGSSGEVLQGNMGTVVSGQTFTGDTSDAQTTAIEGAVLTKYGLAPVSVTVLHLTNSAPHIIAIATDPAMLSGAVNQLLHDLQGMPSRYEGIYLEINDPNGNALIRLSTANRTGGGTSWQSPDLHISTGIEHGGPPVTAPHS